MLDTYAEVVCKLNNWRPLERGYITDAEHGDIREFLQAKERSREDLVNLRSYLNVVFECRIASIQCDIAEAKLKEEKGEPSEDVDELYDELDEERDMQAAVEAVFVLLFADQDESEEYFDTVLEAVKQYNSKNKDTLIISWRGDDWFSKCCEIRDEDNFLLLFDVAFYGSYGDRIPAVNNLVKCDKSKRLLKLINEKTDSRTDIEWEGF